MDSMVLAATGGALAGGFAGLTTVNLWRMLLDRTPRSQWPALARSPLMRFTLRRVGWAGAAGALFGALFEPVLLPALATPRHHN